MANKYIRHGETYCGDGTTPDAATSNGGVGALNSLIYAEGTAWPAPAVLAAGDVVYIRSKDEVGADITRTLSVSTVFGSATATQAGPISWVLDDGVVWTGVDGTLIYLCPSTYVLTLRSYNKLISAAVDRFVIRETNTTPSYKLYLGGYGVTIKNVLCDFSTTVPSGGNGSSIASLGEASVVDNIHVTSRKFPESLFKVDSYSNPTLINPRIELLTATAYTPIFTSLSTGFLTVIGGSVSGAGATSVIPIFTTPTQGVKARLFGFQFPHEMPLSLSAITFNESTIHATGSDGLSGVRMKEKWGEACSRTDAYFPTLNAQLPDSSGTKWSWWIYPTGATPVHAAVFEFGKVFTEAAGLRQIDLEILVGDTFSGVNKSNVWASVSYTDNATGSPVALSTLDASGSALVSSTAGWLPDPPTYGSTAYNKYVLSAVTPTSIKPDTMIHVALFVGATAVSAKHTVIVCPDFVLTAP